MFEVININFQQIWHFDVKRIGWVGLQLWDCRHITLITFNRFCPLSRNPVPCSDGQYQDGKNTNQKQMKNTYSLYIIFQVLKVHLIKICKIKPPDILFFVFISFYIICRHHFSQIFRTSFTTSEKKDFCHKFSFFRRFT